MTPEQRITLQDLSEGRERFAPDKETGRIHRQLVMLGLAACRVEFSGEWISISETGKAQLSARAEYQEVSR